MTITETASRALAAVLAWTAAHPSLTTIIVLPIAGAVVNFILRARTTEELAKLPRPVALFVTFMRTIFPDAGPIMALIAGALLRQQVTPIPGVESIPPPPRSPKDLLPPPTGGFGGSSSSGSYGPPASPGDVVITNKPSGTRGDA